jgi:hypothetical protein
MTHPQWQRQGLIWVPVTKPASARAQRKPTDLRCQHCGNTFAAGTGRTSYCGVSCQKKAWRLKNIQDRVCAWCGQAFQRPADDRGKCCSRACGRRRLAAAQRSQQQT